MSHNLARREFLGIGELGPAETAKRLKKFHEELLRRKPDAATNFSITYRPFVDSRGVWHPGAQVQRRSVR